MSHACAALGFAITQGPRSLAAGDVDAPQVQQERRPRKCTDFSDVAENASDVCRRIAIGVALLTSSSRHARCAAYSRFITLPRPRFDY